MITAALKLPTLFYFGVDGAFGAFTTLVTFLVFMLSRKMWQISKERRYQYFSWVFGGLTASFLARTATNLILYVKYDEVILNPASKSIVGLSNVFLVGYTFHIFTDLYNRCVGLIFPPLSETAFSKSKTMSILFRLFTP